MAMLYLIDGYNLLHAMGLVERRRGREGLHKARENLLHMLHASFGSESANVTVVFDAAKPRRGAPAEMEYHGIHVCFAIGMEQADDLIEVLIRKASTPRHLTVVSDDRRLQKAARRHHCLVNGCGDLLDELERRRQPPPGPQQEQGKPTGLSPDETQHWLTEFADLAGDPALRELQEPPEFFEDERDP
jgi:predicted RNA-binding protein with PIN domain